MDVNAKKKTLSQLDKGTVTRQARNSSHCPENETIKKNLESPRRWNGDKTIQKQQALPRKGTIKKKKKLESTRQWNGHKKSEKQKAVPRKGDY